MSSSAGLVARSKESEGLMDDSATYFLHHKINDQPDIVQHGPATFAACENIVFNAWGRRNIEKGVGLLIARRGEKLHQYTITQRTA